MAPRRSCRSLGLLTLGLAPFAFALALAATAASCGGAVPVREMVESGRWAEACRASTLAREQGERADMEPYQVSSALALRAPAAFSARAWTADEAAAKLRLPASSPLWLRPFSPLHLPYLYDATVPPPDDAFAREWLVLEVTVAVRGSAPARLELGDAELTTRHRATPAASGPFAPQSSDSETWSDWTPVGRDARSELAGAMGYLRKPGAASAVSFWSFVDLAALFVTGILVDPKTRGAAPLLGAPSTAGREPSAQEWQTVDRVLALLGPRCGGIAPGSTCTERHLLRRRLAGRPNWLRVEASYVAGTAGEACSLDASVGVPLVPASSPARQLEAAFPHGARPFAELEERGSRFERSLECERGASGCGTPDCSSSAGCAMHGLCALKGSSCVATAQSCRDSSDCETTGACSPAPQGCGFAVAAAEGCERECALFGQCERKASFCASKDAAHCAASMACLRFGACQVEGAGCAPKTNADCAASEVCRQRGWCTFEAGACRAAAAADCSRSSVCARSGACRAAEGLCVAP